MTFGRLRTVAASVLIPRHSHFVTEALKEASDVVIPRPTQPFGRKCVLARVRVNICKATGYSNTLGSLSHLWHFIFDSGDNFNSRRVGVFVQADIATFYLLL